MMSFKEMDELNTEELAYYEDILEQALSDLRHIKRYKKAKTLAETTK